VVLTKSTNFYLERHIPEKKSPYAVLIESTEATLSKPPFITSREESKEMSDTLRRIKRESEYKSWMILN
jgi:hypothetical protein